MKQLCGSHVKTQAGWPVPLPDAALAFLRALLRLSWVLVAGYAGHLGYRFGGVALAIAAAVLAAIWYWVLLRRVEQELSSPEQPELFVNELRNWFRMVRS